MERAMRRPSSSAVSSAICPKVPPCGAAIITYGQAKFVGGGIAGTSVAGTTIDDCRFGGQFKGSSGDPVALMSDNVCGDKNFTGSGNTLWDGK